MTYKTCYLMTYKTVHPFPFNDRAFLAAALGAFMFGASICSGAAHAQVATEPIWPTKEWQTSSPEEQGMDSKELAKLVDFGTTTVAAWQTSTIERKR